RVHRRMFTPQDTAPGETPVPMELWLVNIDITLTPRNSVWSEDPQFYRSETNPMGLDPAHYKVTRNEYATSVVFPTQGDFDFQVTGHANFVVVNDLEKPVGDASKFMLYLWEDLGVDASTAAIEQKSWASVKRLYSK